MGIDIEQVPFNRYLGIRRCPDPDYLLEVAGSEQLGNHVGTIHAAVILALAEASAGECLLGHIAVDELVAVVCRSGAKYSKPASGVIRSRVETSGAEIEAALKSLDGKRRTLLDIEVGVFSEDGESVAKFSFTWLVSKR